jgi:anti-sigma regulatory factor (Ser/Thr protein kinase)
VDGPGRELALDLAASRSEVARACDEARRFCTANGISEEAAEDVCLALDEVLANVVMHGYGEDPSGRIEVRLRTEPGAIAVEVRDAAPPFDPLAAPAPNLDLPVEKRTIGGLGIHLVRSVMDEVEYERVGTSNVVRLRRWTRGKAE